MGLYCRQVRLTDAELKDFTSKAIEACTKMFGKPDEESVCFCGYDEDKPGFLFEMDLEDGGFAEIWVQVPDPNSILERKVSLFWHDLCHEELDWWFYHKMLDVDFVNYYAEVVEKYA